MTSQRAALRRSDDVVETRRAASFDGPTREVPQRPAFAKATARQVTRLRESFRRR